MTDINGQWQYSVPDADARRGVHVVAVVGFNEHSGVKWHRVGTGTAATLYEGRQGYRPGDIARIEASSGMDAGSGVVVAWMDFITPPLPLEKQGFDCALPTPIREKRVD